jgi:hypothetical protein
MSTEQITKDLMHKLSDDVTGAVRRVLSIAPQPHLPIAMSAGAVCVGFIAATLEHMSEEGREAGSPPDPDCVLLAGLLCAHFGLGRDHPIGAAYADLRTLKAAAAPSFDRIDAALANHSDTPPVGLSEVDALRVVAKAYNHGFNEGLREHTSSRGGKPWREARGAYAREISLAVASNYPPGVENQTLDPDGEFGAAFNEMSLDEVAERDPALSTAEGRPE